MVTSPEKITLPGGGDFYEYVEEQRKMAASQRTVVPVVNIAEADAIATAMASDGRPVTDANPLVVFDLEYSEINVKRSAGWANTPWQALTLAGSWVNYVGGGGYYQGIKCRRKEGDVIIHGMVKSGAGTLATLPAGHWPETTIMHVTEAHSIGGYATLVVSNSDGTISYRAGAAAPSYVMLNIVTPVADA